QGANVALGPSTGKVDRIVSNGFGDGVSRHPGAPKQDHWADYAAGAIEKARQLGLISTCVDIAISSNVPGGAGLSSSAALVTAILRAASGLAGMSTDPETLAHAARAVENDYIGVPCGIMDQLAVGLCDFGEALALNTKTGLYTKIPIPNGWAFAVFHSGVHRKLSDGRYEERFRECADAADLLNVSHLSLLSDDRLSDAAKLLPNLAARTRHVVSDHRRTISAIDAMHRADMLAFAKLMNESHRSYAVDFAASTPEIDTLVSTALVEGASGARLTGGGFGGCIVALMPKESAADIIRRIEVASPSARFLGE
ncbi:MAG: galactokinase, partial [Pseudomonadota bacterium]